MITIYKDLNISCHVTSVRRFLLNGEYIDTSMI